MERGQFSCQFREHIVDRILSLGFVAVAQLDLEAADKIGTTIGVIALEALLYIADLASQFGHPTAQPPIGGQVGSTSCWDQVCQYRFILVVADASKKKNI